MVQLDQEHQVSKRTFVGIQTGANYVTRRVADCTKGKDTTTSSIEQERDHALLFRRKKRKEQQRTQTTQVWFQLYDDDVDNRLSGIGLKYGEGITVGDYVFLGGFHVYVSLYCDVNLATRPISQKEGRMQM